jgi:hypothetical protein
MSTINRTNAVSQTDFTKIRDVAAAGSSFKNAKLNDFMQKAADGGFNEGELREGAALFMKEFPGKTIDDFVKALDVQPDLAKAIFANLQETGPLSGPTKDTYRVVPPGQLTGFMPRNFDMDARKAELNIPNKDFQERMNAGQAKIDISNLEKTPPEIRKE